MKMKTKITTSPRVLAGTNGTVKGLTALAEAMERNNVAEVKNIPVSTFFEISGNKLKLMYDSFSYQPDLIFGGQDKVDGYRLANTISFNSFKIFFNRELDALVLDTKCK